MNDTQFVEFCHLIFVSRSSGDRLVEEFQNVNTSFDRKYQIFNALTRKNSLSPDDLRAGYLYYYAYLPIHFEILNRWGLNINHPINISFSDVYNLHEYMEPNGFIHLLHNGYDFCKISKYPIGGSSGLYNFGPQGLFKGDDLIIAYSDYKIDPQLAFTKLILYTFLNTMGSVSLTEFEIKRGWFTFRLPKDYVYNAINNGLQKLHCISDYSGYIDLISDMLRMSNVGVIARDLLETILNKIKTF